MTLQNRLSLLLIISLGLTACLGDPLANAPTQSIPGADVSTTEARVGEPVQVTLSTTFFAENYGEFVIENASLGACLWFQTPIAQGGACEGPISPLPDSLRLLNGSTLEKRFGDTVVEARGSVRFTHTFTFTSSEPGRVYVWAQFTDAEEMGAPIYIGNLTNETVVTFR